jgi:hypothetical protein
MVQTLVARSMEVMDSDAQPVNFSMITWALGSMNYHPGEVYMKHMIAHLQRSQLIHRFDAQVCAHCLISCAFSSAGHVRHSTPHAG